MVDMSKLLREEIVDEMQDAEIPEGYWKGVIKSGRVDDKDRDGEQRVDKNGDEYSLGIIYVQCDEPLEGVDTEAAERYLNGGGQDETIGRYSKFIRRRRDVMELKQMLEECGALTLNRTIETIMEELKGSDVPCRALIEHRVDERGEKRVEVTEILPPE